LPIIEDCAYALGSQNAEGTIGSMGDSVIYSFSKALPVPYGGLLKSRQRPARASALSAAAQRELPLLLAYYLGGLEQACRRRSEIFEEYRSRFAPEGLLPLFGPEPTAVPHSFVVEVPDQRRAEAMKPLLNAAGIISSVFYGGGGYFLPNHQCLSEAAIDYIIARFLIAFQQTSTVM
jgi:dTDP-4-amino-4,6-dideoxygalactose transaminase